MASAKPKNPNQIDLWAPVSDWQRPTSLPDIPSGATVAIDTETRDNGLNRGVGPGWVHHDGWLSGVSYAWKGGANYLPTRAPDTDCFDQEQVLNWLEDLERRCTLVFQNATYDLGWTGLRPTKRIHDTHAAAVLLDENQLNYSLDAICQRLGVPGKDEEALREAASKLGVDPKAEMWKLPARYVAGYATQDAVATLNAHERQLPMIIGQKLDRAYELECRLIPHVRDMRARGIRIDVDRAEELMDKYYKLRDEALVQLSKVTTNEFRRVPTIQDIRSPQWLKREFDAIKLEMPYTGPTKANPHGNPSFEKDWLMRQPQALPQLIVKARGLHEAAEKFLGNYILSFTHMGRIHAEINQLRDGDERFGTKGTRSYRFSYGNPPLQQIVRPDPDKADPTNKDYKPGFVDIGTEIRSCFLPEEGELFGAPDYSQQEYRWIVIKGDELGLPGADSAAQRYVDDEATDFHNLVRDMTGLTRKRAKDCNFAKAFGAGIPKFAEMAGMTLDEAKATMGQYDEKLPFVARFGAAAKAKADERGYVILLDGYRARFDQWECSWLEKEEWDRARQEGQPIDPCTREEAERRRADKNHVWHQKRIRRAKTHKAGNRVIQGSAAVQTKKALLQQADEGMLPLLQMHDELGHSVPNPNYAKRIVEIMRDVVKRRVPFKVDAEFGPTWGECKKSYEEAVKSLRRK